MSTKAQISNELNESISTILGKNVRILYKSLIRMESRGDKMDNRVLVVSSFRVFITTTKVPTRLENGFHLMEIEALESRKPNHLSITLIHEHKPVSILIGEEGSSEGVVKTLHALVAAFDDLFPNVPIDHIVFKINLPFEIQAISGTRKHSTCGDFSNQYAAMCDLCQTPFRAEVAWDIDTIYLAHDIRLLHLKDFDHLEQRDLIPLLVALQHNTWFRGVCGDGVRAGGEVWEALGRVLRCASPPHEELRWRAAQLRAEHAARLGAALARARRRVAVHTVDLSQNHIEDKGAISVLSGLSKNETGLRHLAFSQCGLTGKAATHLAAVLNDQPAHLSTLTHLDLSHNNLKDDVHNLYNFLAQPNVLKHLNLSNTETTLENMWGALQRGCAEHLSELLLARNPWSAARKPKEPPLSFRQFFTSCFAIQLLDFSHCKMPADALKCLLLGLACNESARGVELRLSGAVTTAQAAHVLESCVHGVRCLRRLGLADTNMELELGGIVRAVGKNHSITHLSLSRLTGKRSYAGSLVQSLVHVLQENDTALTSLDLSDCKLKSDLYALLNALGGARRLRVLDVGGNLAGDAGARLLAKALQCNGSLHTLHLDRNAFSLQGLTDIASALRRSVCVRRVEFPGADAAAGGRGASERVAALWRDLHDALAENATRGGQHALRSLALERAWCGGEAAAALAAQAAAALPPAPLPTALDKAAAAAHHHLHQYLQRCREVFAAMGGGGGGSCSEYLVTLQAVKDALAPCGNTLQELLNEAVENLALMACETVDSNDSEVLSTAGSDIPSLLTPVTSHSGATPLGGRRRESRVRRVRPKSVAEQQSTSSNEMLSLPPLHTEAADGLADLPHNHHRLHHLVKGRPKRAKTRAPSRPTTDQPQDIGEGLEEFWRACRTPPGSEEPSLSARTPLASRSLRSLASLQSLLDERDQSPTLRRRDTFSTTSGDSTPVLLDSSDVSRCKSSDDVGGGKGSPPPPSRSSDDVNTVGNGCARAPGRVRPWSVAGGAGVAGGAASEAACTTGSMMRDHPLTPDEVIS